MFSSPLLWAELFVLPNLHADGGVLLLPESESYSCLCPSSPAFQFQRFSPSPAMLLDMHS